MMRKVLIPIILVIFGAALFTATMAGAAPFGKSAWPMKIEYVTFVDRNHEMIVNIQPVLEEIEKKSEGKLKFIYRGGPEAIKIFAQAMAAYKGAVDMVFTTPSFMGKLVKGTEMLTLTNVPVSQHRKIGLYDYMNEVFNRVNMQYLMMYPREVGTAFTILSKKKIEKVEDFNGMSVRGADWMDGVAPLFGMSTVSMKHFEEYNGLERGLIDAGRMTLDSMYKFRLWEVAKYLIEPPFASTPASWFMNLDKWDSLPADLQEMIIDTLYEHADEIEAKTKNEIEKMRQEMIANGVEVVELQGAEQEKYLSMMEKGMYDYFMKDNPEVSQKIYDLTR